MKTYLLTMFVTAAVSLLSTIAMADSINGRAGVTGRLGFTVPSDSDISGGTVSTDPGFVYGGGFIYGVTDTIAAELDITSSSFDSNTLAAPIFGRSDFTTINISMGAQYRFLNIAGMRQLVPYAGGGLDILLNDVNTAGAVKVDDTVGIHVAGGVDYFLTKDVVLTSELKGVFAPNADLKNAADQKIGNFDPNNFTMTVGARYMFR